MKLGFIGGGTMATAIINCAGIKNLVSVKDIYVAEPNEDNIAKMQKLGVNVVANASELPQLDCYFLCVKPQNIQEACAALKEGNADEQKAIISIVAGVTTHKINDLVGGGQIVRTMPNTPLLVNQGCTFAYTEENIADPVTKITQDVFSTVGKFFWINDEEQMDAVTALSGSGPAYVYLLVEIMAKAGAKLGINPQEALEATIATVKGACELLEKSNDSPETLRKQVTSTGGTTEAAIKYLTDNKFDEILTEAIKSAKTRSEDLANE